MGAAEIISFEEVRARKQGDTLRQQLHKRFDQWIDTLGSSGTSRRPRYRR